MWGMHLDSLISVRANRDAFCVERKCTLLILEWRCVGPRSVLRFLLEQSLAGSKSAWVAERLCALARL